MSSYPKPNEYAPYAKPYVDLVPTDVDIISHLKSHLDVYKESINNFATSSLTTPHEEGEWTIQEVLMHVIDVERIFSYRMLRFGRQDTTELAGFDQDAYVPTSRANERSVTSIMEEFTAVRHATITLVNSYSNEDLARPGVGSGFTVTVRGLLYHLAGHAIHHLDSIHENYGTSA
ncbi:MAG: DinB family protein [Chloroflexota bacterium]